MKYPSLADIAEMKARGYDPTTIAEAERQLEQWAAVQQVCHAIETAFAGVTLEDGIGLQEAQGLDDYADAATCAAYRAKDEKDDWHRLSAEALNQCGSSLSFFDAKGMRFHLPAYLLADLRGDDGSGLAFRLTNLSSQLNQFALLSPVQRAAVRSFLLHILDDRDYKFYRSDIERALAEYWTTPVSA